VADNRRQHERYAARVQVRFSSAVDFVAEYADNLSAGGLFLRGAHQLEPLGELEVDLALPGYGEFRIGCRVAHVITPEQAAKSGRRAGAGVEIVRQPDGFAGALEEYLRRLGRRREVAVVVDRGVPLELLAAAGFHTLELPPPAELLAILVRSQHPVLAVVLSSHQMDLYRTAAEEAGLADLFRRLDGEQELDQLLAELDQLL
jgi:hypothetical protein